MNKMRYTPLWICTAVFAMTIVSCDPDMDEPPVNTIPVGNVISLAELAQIRLDSGGVDGVYKFTEDYSIFATVTADKIGGNFYKSVFIEDSTAALNMRTLSNGGVYIGDYIRVNLNGAIISEYAQLLQLDSVDVDQKVVIQANGQFITPAPISMNDALTDDFYIGRLVEIDEVEFVDDDLGSTYAVANGTSAQNRYIQDCNDDQLIVRTSDFSSFAGQPLPGGNGSMIGILSRFNNDRQMLLRKVSEVELTDLRCDGSTGEFIFKDTFDELQNGQSMDNSSNWSTYSILNDEVDWDQLDDFGVTAARVSSFNGQANLAETWMVSTSIDLSTYASANLFFTNTKRFSGQDMKLFVSTDHVEGQDPTSSTWVELPVDFDTDEDSWDMVSTTPLSLSDYLMPSVHFAFAYYADNSDACTYQIDDFTIFE